ncbi:hypothetical protein [Flavobacterium sp. ZE23DGlu08]|uniref:hypothetical protein n=1 Tax=Flavobacterium sp. ZE23DGlu08 TaxID=3059026 RepID=UPI002660502C|nr:hypothetical protein [Flavobacterium sp. ZE23DGlu08]WKL43752.1 hypothetical protein Q1W72_15565 [Flavobacterium sp. ZE23DGlu08]
MKTIKYLLMSFAAIVFISCQNEETLIIQDTTQNLMAVSPLTSLISRVSQNPTSKDNVLDNSSCFNVHLPVIIIVNGKQITVSDQNDYVTVQSALDAFSNDDDIVNFVYPITIQYQNFKTQLITNSDQLDDVIDNCDEDDGFDEIDCIHINYPIKINIYNSDNQIANTITIQNDTDLYNFLEDIESNVFISINYPVSITNFNGQNVVITNNSDFENSIEDGIKDCNTNSSTGGNQNFTSILTDGTWHVSYYFDDTDETSNYNGYNFAFNSNGTVVAVKGTNNIGGTWSTFVNSGQDMFLLKFDDSKLDELKDDWKITEYTTTNVRLKNKSSSDGETDYLYFTKN